jgi:hypothetical protein
MDDTPNLAATDPSSLPAAGPLSKVNFGQSVDLKTPREQANPNHHPGQALVTTDLAHDGDGRGNNAGPCPASAPESSCNGRLNG